MKYQLDPLSPTGVSPVALTPTQIAMSVGGGGESLWEVNTYGSLDYLQPIDTTNGLVLGSDLHSSVTTAFTTVAAVFNGDTVTGSSGLNYFIDIAYGTDGFAFGGLFVSGHAGGTPSAPTQVVAGKYIGAYVFTAYSGSAWVTAGTGHILPGLWSISAADVTTTLEQNIFLGGVATPMIGFETDTNAIIFNESQLDSDITAYWDSGVAWSTNGATGVVSMPNGASIVPRVSSEASSATPTINTDNVDAHSITALAAAITSFTTNLSGTPANFQKLTIRIKDNGTARAITWGSSFEAKGVPLPTTTVVSKVLTVGFIYDTVTSKWGCVASAQEA